MKDTNNMEQDNRKSIQYKNIIAEMNAKIR